MPYQQAVFANQQIYHVFNRGVEKRITFIDKRDYERFIETLNYYRIKTPPTRFWFKNRAILAPKKTDESPIIEHLCFCLMPNHFHLLLRQVEENGITKFMSKVSNSYTKYFNTKRKRVGALFQGSFKAIRIEDIEQLLHVSRYIHLNPLIDYLVKDLRTYSYSSYPEYLGLESGFCVNNDILGQFSKKHSYESFVLDQEDYGRTIKNMERLLLDIEG